MKSLNGSSLIVSPSGRLIHPVKRTGPTTIAIGKAKRYPVARGVSLAVYTDGLGVLRGVLWRNRRVLSLWTLDSLASMDQFKAELDGLLR